MTVAKDHTAIQSEIPRFFRGYDFNFCRDEVFLINIVFFLHELKDLFLHRLFRFSLQRTSRKDHV